MTKDIYNDKRSVIFKHYFSRIKADTRVFRKALLPLLNENWNKNGELLIEKIQSFSDGQENNTYRECITATKDYINSRDFMAPNKYETTSYFYGALQYNSESEALKNLNQKLNQLMQDIPEQNTSWSESFENLWVKTASTLFSAFDFAKEHPLSTITTLLYGQVALASAFPAVFNLSSLDGVNGVKINGEATGDSSGMSVSFAGDINGDGISDLIIGAPFADPHEISAAGSSYVIFGKCETWATPLELSTLNGINGFRINGEAKDDKSGRSVSAAGDINGDGIADLFISASGADPGGNSSAGSSYVIFGKNEAWTTPLELSTLNGTNGFKINGEAADDFSSVSVSSAGDFNGDGIDDLIIGAVGADPDGKSTAGSSYVIFGKDETCTTPLELSTLNGINGFKINGEAAGDNSGMSVSFAGDINGDGIDDLIIGAYYATPNEESRAGSSYVIFGKNETWVTPLELSTLNGINGFKINGEIAGDKSGSSVSFAGDINGDGVDDLIIGASRACPNGKTYAGSSYVIFGKTETWATPFELSTLDGINGFKINGEMGGDSSGSSVSFAGDINGDGIADLIIGAYGAAPNGKSDAGSSYVIFGKTETWAMPFELSTLDGINGFKINGEMAYDYSGASVSAAGDINGDGIDDLIIGAHSAGSSAGSSYVIFGNNLPSVLTGNNSSIDYSENEPEIIDDSITITDVDSKNLEGGVVSIVNNFQAEDELNFVDQNGIVGVYNSTIGVLTLTGSSVLANYQMALRSIKYHNLSDDPTVTPRNISFRVNDRWHNSNLIFRMINIISVDDVPILTNNGGSFDYIENDPEAIIDSSIAISDGDNVNLTNATIAIANNFHYPEDVLNFIDQNEISGVYNDATGVLTLTGSASIAHYQTALHNVTYENLADNPVIDMRTITFIVNDGVENSNAVTRDINIISVNDAPVLANDGGSFDYTENDPATIVDSSITISDVDDVNLTNATIAITNNFHYPEDILTFIDQNGINGFYNNAAGILTLTGSSSIAYYQAALRNITYINLSDHPTTDLRTVTFIVNDGVENSNAITRNINIIPVQDVPVITLSKTALNYTENSGAIVIDPTLTVVDLDNANLTGAIVSIANNFNSEQDILIFIDQNNIGGAYNDTTGVLSLAGSSSVTNYQTALRSIEYENLSDYPTNDPRNVTFMVYNNDGESKGVSRKINIIAVNDSPVLSSDNTESLNYTENEAPKIIDNKINIFDWDNINLANATIAITDNFNATHDVLSFTNQNGIVGLYYGEIGVLTLTGTSSVDNYQMSLRNVTYQNLFDHPSVNVRTISFMVNDGHGNSNEITRIINIIPVNDVPVLTNDGGSFNYTENDLETIIDSSIIVADVDNVNLTNATIAITNNFHYPEDILIFIDQNGISGLYNNATGVLRLTGSSSIAHYQTALRNVTYENLSDDPTTDLRAVTFIVNDGIENSNAITRDINIIPVQDVPTITLNEVALNYTENSGAVAIDPTLTVVGLDNANLTGGVVSIVNNFYPGQDGLIFIDQNNIDGSYNDTTGILSLAGSSSIANYQTALRSIEYENLSENPITDPRNITFVVYNNDGESAVVSRNINIIAVNDLPILSSDSVTSLNYTENGAPKIIDNKINVSDWDNINLTNATIAITNNFHAIQDILSFTNQDGIIGLYEGETGILKLTGSSSIENYQTALRNVTYQNLFDHPSTDIRTISFVVNDGYGNSNVLTRNINVISVDDAPTITLNSAALNYTEGSGVVAIDPTLILGDIDHANLTEAVVSITNNFDSEQDVLTFIAQNDIEGFYNDTSGILSLTGSSNVVNYQTALRSVEYENLSDDPTTSPRTISFVVDDGAKISASATRHINIIPVNNAPVLTNSGVALNYTENAPATLIDPSITVFDVDNINLAGATVSITGNFDFMQDRLSFTNQNYIIGSYNSALGVLTLSGSSNITNYQAALRSVRYNNLSENPSTADRTVSFIVSDGEASGTAITRVIHIIPVHDRPVVTVSGSTLSYTEKEPAKIIDIQINIADLDSTDLYWATVSITNNFDVTQDVLRFINQNGITGSYNNETGILTLTGTSNIANYQIALRDVRYENLSDNPTTDPRSIAFVVNDGFVSSVPAVRNITITPLDNTPSTDDGGFFDFGSKLFNTILLASIGGLIGFLFLALRICLYRKATQSFEKLTSIGDVSTTEQQKKFQTNVLRPIAQAIFDRIKITGCFGYISDNRMKDYLSAVTQLIVALQQQAINVDLDNLSPASQSLLINVIAKQTENVLLPAQGCCTCGACCRCLSKLYSAQVSPEVMEAQVVAIAVAIKNALKRNNYDTFLSRQSVGSGSNQSQPKVYEAPIEMAVLGGGLFAKSGNAPLPTPVNQVAVEKPVFGGADAKYVPMEAPLLKSFNSNQAKDKVCAIDLVQSNMSRFGNSADPSYRVDPSQPKSPAFFQGYDENKPRTIPVSKGLDAKQNVFRG